MTESCVAAVDRSPSEATKAVHILHRENFAPRQVLRIGHGDDDGAPSLAHVVVGDDSMRDAALGAGVGASLGALAGAKGSAAELEVRRRLAVRMLSQGVSPSEVAELVGADLSSVKRWKAAWKRGGDAALAAKPRPGRTPRLTTAQKR